MPNMFELAVIAEVALAMLLGGLIGLERELANKSAGFRTHMLVAGAAARCWLVLAQTQIRKLSVPIQFVLSRQ